MAAVPARTQLPALISQVLTAMNQVTQCLLNKIFLSKFNSTSKKVPPNNLYKFLQTSANKILLLLYDFGKSWCISVEKRFHFPYHFLDG